MDSPGAPEIIEIEASDLSTDEWLALELLRAVKPAGPGQAGEALAARIQAHELEQRLSPPVLNVRFRRGMEMLEARGACTIRRVEGAADPLEGADVRMHCLVVSRLVKTARGLKPHLRHLAK